MRRRRVARFGRVAALALMAIAAPLVLTACAGAEQSGTPAQRVDTWVSGAGAGPAIGAVEADNVAIDRALADH
ncbi:MAG TPA: hypothetical protein VHZ02_01305, partial [Acidimicrobiales bacterium]|nr:hypothetical protein [Acidimicrobiales bacterium]